MSKKETKSRGHETATAASVPASATRLGSVAARLLLLGTLVVTTASVVLAEDLVAVRSASAPVIDGRIEELWHQARGIDGFVQIEPALGERATTPTEAYLLYDDEKLYAAARFTQPPSTLRGSSGRRDDTGIWDGDYLLIAVDPSASGNTAFFFVVNPANGLIDGILDSSGNFGREWDGQVDSATRTDETGWSVELAVALDSIGFQTGTTQQWGVLVGHHYAERREKTLDAIRDRNAPFRVDTFRPVAFEFADVARPVSFSPYALALGETRPDSSRDADSKVGADLRWAPSPTMTLLGTFNPDFAQLESDVQVINATDVPTSYPEKRPFFTESADLYPGLAVNTRNIGEIVAGAKLRQVQPLVRYDLTAVLDKDSNEWLLGDVRWTDNRRFHLELLGGLKHAEEGSDYNLTTNLRTWAFDKRLTAYTWFGTINGPDGGSNEWESVNAVKWVTRTFRAGLWNQFKSELYNPNVVGHNTLSNEVIVAGWLEWSRFVDDSVLRELSSSIWLNRFDLYTRRGNDYTNVSLSVTARFNAPGRLGLWTGELTYVPGKDGLFRYRGPDVEPDPVVHRDALGEFVLVRQHRDGASLALSSDPSRHVAGSVTWKTGPVRGASSHEVAAELVLKLGTRSLVGGSIGRLEVGESDYQKPYTQTLGRVRFEHTFANDLNVRALYQKNSVKDEWTTSRPTVNLLVSWPVSHATTLHLVADQTREELTGVESPVDRVVRSLALKASHTFSARW